LTKKVSKKVCLLGDFAVGKTSLVRRFVYALFDDKYISTIGVKVSRKTVALPRGDEVVELTLMLWDLAGSEAFSRVRASYMRGAVGAVLVCDVTRPETLDGLLTCVQDLRGLSPDAKFVFAGNKSDLEDQQQFTLEDIERVAADLGAPCYLTSAKTGMGVEALFRHLGQMVIA
jgi:small GTP-binding protein